MSQFSLRNCKIGVVGLGYVGLPLAVEFGKHFRTVGFDIKAAVPGGLWVQKDREVYFCNSGRALDNDVLCWRLREPVKGQVCQ